MSALRAYLRELRIQKHISQREMADAIGLSLRAFSDWETGKSEELKGSSLVRAVSLLSGSWDDITRLVIDNKSDDEGEILATKRIEMPKMTTEDDVDQLIQELRNNKQLQRACVVFWSGWKARE